MAANNQTVLRILWSRFAWRHWRLSPVSSLLLLMILALGVAAFFSIRLANRAAVASFQNFTDLITSQSDGLITAPVGDLSETILPELRQLLGNEPVNIVPVLESSAVPPRRDENEALLSRPTFQMLGLDLPALVNLDSQQDNRSGWFGSATSDSTNNSEKGFSPVLQNPLSVFISEALAKHDGLKIGSPLPLIINEHPVSWTFAHVQPPGGLQNYYRENVTGGPGSFVLEIRDFKTFADAMTRKLVAEIAAVPAPERFGSIAPGAR